MSKKNSRNMLLILQPFSPAVARAGSLHLNTFYNSTSSEIARVA